MKSMTSLTLIATLLLTAPLALAKTVSLETSQSTIRWIGKKTIGQQHDGTVSVQSGQLEVDGNRLKGGEVIIDMASIKNDDLKDPEYNAKLVGHLKSDDFFGVAQHSTSKFKIKSVKSLKNRKDATHEITGDLTIKGITQSLTFPAKIEFKGGVASAKGKLTIDRTKYNIRYGSGKFFENLGDKMISDDFEIEIDLKAKT